MTASASRNGKHQKRKGDEVRLLTTIDRIDMGEGVSFTALKETSGLGKRTRPTVDRLLDQQILEVIPGFTVPSGNKARKEAMGLRRKKAT